VFTSPHNVTRVFALPAPSACAFGGASTAVQPHSGRTRDAQIPLT
jgi:hypothetical protein